MAVNSDHQPRMYAKLLHLLVSVLESHILIHRYPASLIQRSVPKLRYPYIPYARLDIQVPSQQKLPLGST